MARGSQNSRLVRFFVRLFLSLFRSRTHLLSLPAVTMNFSQNNDNSPYVKRATLYNMSLGEIRELSPNAFPSLLAEIPDPPTQLWASGALPSSNMKLLAVVGSREHTGYAEQVISYLVQGLAGYNIGIVSGLARGVDTLAHTAALQHGLYTCAIPGSGLDRSVLYPARNKALADRILATNGGLLSELSPLTPAAQWTFPARNRIMAGMCHATLLIEAGKKSGTLITARLAVDYNRELLVVPGSIFSPTSRGNHQFLKLGAVPVTHSDDILIALGIEKADTAQQTPSLPTLTPIEMAIMNELQEPQDQDTLIRLVGEPASVVNIALMKLEINGIIMKQNAVYIRLTN
jgi:DNA processing protein